MQSRNEDVPTHPPRETVAADPWSQLAQARTAEQLCQAWLPVLCSMLTRPHSGLLLLQDVDGSYAPAAVWPGNTDLSYLGEIAQEALVQRKGVVSGPPRRNWHFLPMPGTSVTFATSDRAAAHLDDVSAFQPVRLARDAEGFNHYRLHL